MWVIIIIYFYSAKDTGLLKKTRDLLSHLAFATDPPSGMSQARKYTLEIMSLNYLLNRINRTTTSRL